MGRFIVNGGAPLFGRVRVSGSKNAALPILFASIITRGVSVIEDLPDIGDVRVAIDIIERLGATVVREGTLTRVNTESLTYTKIPDTLLSRLRASTYLLGAMLVRFGRAEIGCFGGCNFAPRPIDMHLDAIRSHGASIGGSGEISSERLYPSEITFAKRSVGATVNALILASGIPGESVIRGCATEPHILNLIEYLRSCGADIALSGDTATVRGTNLRGGSVSVGGDMIEAGTMLTASLLTGGAVRVVGVSDTELLSFTQLLTASGVIRQGGEGIMLTGMPEAKIRVVTLPYPGFPTDLQPIISPLLSHRGGWISDTVWRDRLGYLEGLSRFGVRSRAVDGVAEIFPSELVAAEAEAADLRGGMALIIAALAAEGVSVIRNGELVLRGYERLVDKLCLLGAEIDYKD